MENEIKKVNRTHKPETKEKISNSQRMRFARYKKALRENEFRKLELKNPYDNVPLDDYELMLELRFQVADEFNLLIDALFDLFEHQMIMAKKKSKEKKVDEIISKANISNVLENVLNDFIDKEDNTTKQKKE